MTIIDDKLEIERTPTDSAAADPPSREGWSRKRGMLAAGTAIAVAAVVTVAAVQVTGSTDLEDQPGPATQSDYFAVVGAVYVGPAPGFGGDPVRGETDESYFGRTGRHLPGLSSAMLVEGPWWYGPSPVVGGDPVPGETDGSYYGRTGRHLPSQFSTG